jgi:hypothetical protein
VARMAVRTGVGRVGLVRREALKERARDLKCAMFCCGVSWDWVVMKGGDRAEAHGRIRRGRRVQLGEGRSSR